MILMSNNLKHYLTIPEDAVIRVNLAWYNPQQLEKNLSEITHDVFLDVPVGRAKPPMNRYNTVQIIEIASKFPKVKYLGVSNVESPADIATYQTIAQVTYQTIAQIIPKIETVVGIINCEEIIQSLGYEQNYLMLDHEDLYNDLLKRQLNPKELYSIHVAKLKKVASENNTKVLQTAGIVFHDSVA